MSAFSFVVRLIRNPTYSDYVTVSENPFWNKDVIQAAHESIDMVPTVSAPLFILDEISIVQDYFMLPLEYSGRHNCYNVLENMMRKANWNYAPPSNLYYYGGQLHDKPRNLKF